jgi:hypothetical protein
MDVFCVGMYRSCSTWQYEVAAELVERHRGGRRLGFVSGAQFEADAGPPSPATSWRVLKSHNGHHAFAAALAGRRALAVYAYRDLRDVAFSLVHKLGRSFTETVEYHGYLDTCLSNDHFWTCQPRMLCQRYEDLVSDPAAGVRALAAHLGIALGEEEAAALADTYSLGANRRRSADLAERSGCHAAGQEPDAATGPADPETLLHWNHIRAGRVGGWRDEATPRQLALLAIICGSWLIARGYEPDDRWAIPAIGYLCRQLETWRIAVHDMMDDLERATTELHDLQQLGPVALGLARRLHHASLRYPRVAATAKRFVGRTASHETK